MPKIKKIVARKDYPKEGIKKGDEYYFTSIRTGRGGRVLRSLTPFKQSQLTNSPFLSGWYAASEAWGESAKDADAMREAAVAIRELGEEAQNSFDNMPEGLQMGDTGQTLENRASHADSIAGDLESLADEWDALDDPEDEDAPQEPEQGDRDDDDQDYLDEMKAYETATEERDHAISDYEDEKQRLQDEADTLLEDTPE